ncbi:Two-component response regulator-like APRR7 [Forsythia ovata]|uniref:Two-component response regulator-like APRR7 n=1 Tax=Forsythia ovata TaxID=205694 RepID=A0ABD1TNW6_9LAMI
MDIVDGVQQESPNEDKGIEDGVLAEGQSSFEDNELKVNTANEDASRLQGRGILQIQQLQQPQRMVVCWERFLHVRSVWVLLVENDDSTRHVVSALLRNCNYEVLEAANGLQAWNILEDLTNHIDIVLTEAVMPCFSGIGLLCKVMSHRTRRNIPVIMMSSHDSMGLIFKCLSKGAADFLLKPIRKNELKNLWQHIWRRCHSSSGSGSGSSTRTSKSCDKSDNSDSDDGSGTQSSWTKQAVEVESTPAMSPMDQVANVSRQHGSQSNPL